MEYNEGKQGNHHGYIFPPLPLYWLNDQCAEVEEQFGNNHRIYKRINEISGRKSGCIGSGCIKKKE